MHRGRHLLYNPRHLLARRGFHHAQLTFNDPNADRVKEVFSVNEAVRRLKLDSVKRNRKFVESVDIVVKLGVDPRKPNQGVRGVVTLPHGTGKTIKVAVFARGAKAEEAKAAGAIIVGAEDLVKSIQEGELGFERCIATPDMMPLVGRIGKILGPRGLMPNPKLGTVTTDVAAAVQAAQGGQVEFRVERNGLLHAGLGKINLDEDKILENIRTFMMAIAQAKPEGAKGTFIKKAHLSTTMGKAYLVETAQINPQSGRFMMGKALVPWEDALLQMQQEMVEEEMQAQAILQEIRRKKAEKKKLKEQRVEAAGRAT